MNSDFVIDQFQWLDPDTGGDLNTDSSGSETLALATWFSRAECTLRQE